MKFSVLMCLYYKDNSNYFKKAYESILKQALLPDQFVLVVDGPVGSQLEDCVDCLEAKCEASGIIFTPVWLPENVGHGNARRIGVEHCSFDIIAIADSDDINLPERFLKQVTFLKNNPDVSVLGGQIIEIDESTEMPIANRCVPAQSNDIAEYIKRRCPFNQMSVIIRKPDILSVGNYMDFYHNEDYFLWIRLYEKGFTLCNLDEVLVYARVDPAFYNRRGGYKYFLSEYKIQKILRSKNIVSTRVFIENIVVRFIVQVVMPSRVRAVVFKLLFRRQ